MSTIAINAPKPRQQWSGQWGFILSAIGSAVGLGNIWRFPGVAYENGGGAFLIPYLVALITAGIPILFLDYAIGHRFRGSAPLALRRVARWLESLGWFQVMICVFIFLYYAAILAWAASYFVFSFDFAWGDDPVAFLTQDYLELSDASAGFSTQPAWGVFIPMVLIWVATIVVMALNLTKGLEKVNVICMPLLAIVFSILVVRSIFLPGAIDGINALFTPDFSKIGNPDVWIAAYSQIFFSLSVAFGIMMTYSSYRRRKANLTAPGLVVAFANSSFELLAGLGVFSILGFMAYEQNTTISELGVLKGVGLSFMTFPKAIASMPGGQFFGALFFLSLLLAGFTSLVSIFEVISSALMDKFGLARANAALVIGIPAALVSLSLFGTASGLNTLDIVDNWTNVIGIVLSAIIMIVGVLWIGRRGEELAYHLSSLSTFKIGATWRVLAAGLSCLVLIYIFVNTVISLIQTPYGGGDYPDWYNNIAGWGSILLMFVGVAIFTALPWKHNPDDFTPWPLYEATKKGGVK